MVLQAYQVCVLYIGCYSIVDGPARKHNQSLQYFSDDLEIRQLLVSVVYIDCYSIVDAFARKHNHRNISAIILKFATSPLHSCRCVFVLMLNVPVNNFSVMLGQSHHFLCLTSTFRGVNVSLLNDTTLRR